MVKIIDSYNALPLGAYLDILDINSDECLDDLGRQTAILAVLTGLNEKDVLLLPLDEYASLAAHMEFLSHDVPQPRRSIGKILSIGKNKYRIPQNPAKITTAQFVDFRSWAESWKDGKRPVPEILSTMIVPEGKTYGDDYEVEDVQADIRENLDTVTAFALCAFFLDSWRRYIMDSLSFSEKALKRIENNPKAKAKLKELQTMTELLTSLQESGRGSIMYALLRQPPILRGTTSGIWDASNS